MPWRKIEITEWRLGPGNTFDHSPRSDLRVRRLAGSIHFVLATFYHCRGILRIIFNLSRYWSFRSMTDIVEIKLALCVQIVSQDGC
jgi:hypothetical protein